MPESQVHDTGRSSNSFRSRARVAALAVAAIAGLLPIETVHAQGTPPLAVLTLAHSVVGSHVTFVWVPSSQGPAPTVFLLQAGSVPGAADIATVRLPGTQTSFAVDAAAGTYYVRILATNGAGASAPSNEVVVTIGGGGGCVAPGAPTGLVATPGPLSVTIRWTAPTTGGAPSGYVLEAGSVAGASNLGVFQLANATTLSSPAPAGAYFVRIRAVNACGSSPPSAELSFTVTSGAVAPISLPAGVYAGQMFNNTRNGLGRPPITTFQLTLNQATPAAFSMISARWQDNAGCVKTNFIYAGTSNGRLSIDVETLTCNDGDLLLNVTSVSGNLVAGTCNGGANCTFQMVKQ